MTEHAAPPGTVARFTLATLLIAWLLALLLLRFGFIEIEAEQDPCLIDTAGIACRLRSLLGMGIHFGVFGIVAITLALASHLPLGGARAALATAALFAAVCALVLYNPGYGAPATVIALFALADQGLFRRRAAAPGR